MRIQCLVTVAGVSMLLAGRPVMAHHAFAAEFDGNRPVKLRGTVTKMAWVNPHAWIYIDVKDSRGNVVSWMIEAGAPNATILPLASVTTSTAWI